MPSIFLTGATGHVGFRVLVLALQEGYSVRAAVRSLSKTKTILAAPSIKALNPCSRLKFVEISNLTAVGAYDVILEDTDYIIRVAAPIASTTGTGDDWECHYIGPSVQETLNLLKAARRYEGIKCIVIILSLVAIMDISKLSGDSDAVNEKTRATGTMSPPFDSVMQAYCVSKSLAFNMAEKWIQDEKPHSGVTHILPGGIYGPNELVTNPAEMLLAGTNRVLLTPVSGDHYKLTTSSTIHLDDVAKSHIDALDPKIPTNRLFFLHSGGVQGREVQDLFEIVRKNFPSDVGGLLPNNGSISTQKLLVDSSESEKTLGFKYKPFEQMVIDVVGYYVQQLKKQKAVENV